MVVEYERAKVTERCRRRRLHAARQHSVSILNAAPYRNRYVSSLQTGGLAAFEIVLRQARVARQIFQ